MLNKEYKLSLMKLNLLGLAFPRYCSDRRKECLQQA